jgi:thiol-disulfide isomerase/thioredoxin
LWGLLALALVGCSSLAAPGEEGPAGAEANKPAGEELEATPQAPDPALEQPQAPQVLVELEDFGPAPELRNDVWLNVDAPLRLADLRGQVVLLDMWTFGCINCKNVIPSIREWHHAYGDQGLVVIGNHYPEFNYEEDLDNLKEAIVRLDVPYAVAQDNDGKTWRAYNNRYWPTLYLIDKSGRIRYRHIGEGGYEETEVAIQALLAEPYP